MAKDGLLRTADALKDLTSAQKLESLITQQSINNSKGLTQAQTAQILATQGVSAEIRQGVAAKINEIAVLKDSIQSIKTEIDDKKKLIATLRDEALAREQVAALSKIEGNLSGQKEQLQSLEESLSDTQLKDIGSSKGKLIGTAVASSLFSVLSNFSNSRQAKDATEAASSSIVTSITSGITGAMQGASMGGVPGAIIGGLIGAALPALSSVLGYVSGETERAIEKANELTESFERQRNTIQSAGETINSISSDYERLSKGVSDQGKNISLSSEEYSNYNSIVNQIAEMFPKMVAGYTDEGNAILQHKGNVEALTVAYQDLQQELQNDRIAKASDVWEGFYSSLNNFNFFSQTASTQDMIASGEKYISLLKEYVALLNSGADTEELDAFTWKLHDLTSGSSGIKFTESISELLRKAGVDTKEGIGLRKTYDEIEKITAAYKNLVSEANSKTVQAKLIFNDLLDTDNEFQKLDSDIQDSVKTLFSNFDYTFFSKFKTNNEMYAWVQENLIKPLNDSNTSSQMQSAIQSLLNPKFDGKSAEQLDEYIKNVLADIEKNAPALFEKLTPEILIKLGFDIDVESTTDAVVKSQNELTKFKDKLAGEFTKDELDLIIQANASVDFSGEDIDEVRRKFDAWQEDVQKAARDESFVRIQKQTAETVEFLSAALSEQSRNGKISQKTYSDLISKGEDYEKLVDIIDGNLVLLNDDTVKYNNELIKTAIQTAILNGSTEEQIEQLMKLMMLTQSVTDSLKSLSDTARVFKDVQDDLNDGDGLTLQSYENLLRVYPELEQALSRYLVGLASEQELEHELRIINQNKTAEIQEQAKLRAILAIDEVKQLAEAYELDAENFKSVEEFKNAILNSSKFEQLGITNEVVKDKATEYGIDLDNFKEVERLKVQLYNEAIEQRTKSLREEAEMILKQLNNVFLFQQKMREASELDKTKIDDSFLDKYIYNAKDFDISETFDALGEKAKKSNPIDKLLSDSNFYNEQLKDLEKSLESITEEIKDAEMELSKAEAFGDEEAIREQTLKLQGLREQLVDAYAGMLKDTRNIKKEIQAEFSQFADVELSDTNIANFKENIQNQITQLQNINNKTESDSIKRNNELRIQSFEQQLALFNEYVSAMQAASDMEKKIPSEISKIRDTIYKDDLKLSDSDSDKRIKNLEEEYAKTKDIAALRAGLQKELENSDITETQSKEIEDLIAQYSKFSKWFDQTRADITVMERSGMNVRDIIAKWRDTRNTISLDIEVALAEGWDETSDEIEEMQEALEESEDQIQSHLDEIVSGATTALDNIQTVYDTLQRAGREIADTGVITTDTFKDITAIGIEYLSYLTDENGQLAINHEAIQKVIKAKTQQLAIESALNYVEAVEAAHADDKIDELNRLAYATEQYNDVTLQSLYDRLDALGLEADVLEAIKSNLANYFSYHTKADDGIGKITAETIEINNLYEAETKLKAIQEERIALERNIESSVTPDGKLDAIREEVDLYRQEIEALREINKLRNAQINENVDKLRSKGFEIDYDPSKHYLLIKNWEHVNELQAEGVKTTDETRQEYNGLIETTMSLVDANKANADSIFDVTKAMNASFDSIVAKANEALDTVESVYSTFLNAAQEFADSGFITVDTFQQILSQGVKYLAYLVDENGQLNITEDAIHRVIAAKTEQVAIETALNYISAIRQALIDDQIDTLNNLIYATEGATDSTWGLVNASLAQLKLLGLSDEQYQAVANQVNTMRSLADSAIQSIGKQTDQLKKANEEAEKAAKEAYQAQLKSIEEQENALEGLLKLVKELIKQQKKDQIEAINMNIKAFEELIDLRKQELREMQKKRDFEKELTNDTKNLAKLQVELAKLERDNSGDPAIKAKKQQLMEDIADMQGNIDEKIYNKYVDEQETA